MGVVILSTVVFILSTMPELTDDIDMLPNTNTSEPVERWEDVNISVLFIVQSELSLLSRESLQSWHSPNFVHFGWLEPGR